MLTRSKKEEIVRDIAERVSKHKVLFFSNFKGIGVNKLSEFRRKLKSAGGEFKVIRKTLLDRALQEKKLNTHVRDLPGEIGVIFGYESEIEPAKVAAAFGKENQTFQVISGFLNGTGMTGQEVMALAALPSREQLLGKLVGVLSAPIGHFQNVLQANIRGLAVILSHIKT